MDIKGKGASMTKWQEVKKLQKINEPKRKVIWAVNDTLANGVTIDDIALETNIPSKRVEDIILGLEPTMTELVLIANFVGYNIDVVPA